MGGGAASVFAVYGSGNVHLTIARGTMPLSRSSPRRTYAYRLGIIGAPARIGASCRSACSSLLIDAMGSRILIVSSALSLAALLALCLLHAPPPRSETKADV